MLKEERYDKILNILDEKDYITSQELAKMLYVSMPTIRRDLAYLESKKQLVRSHGGAKRTNTEHIVAPLDFRKNVNHAEKRQISKAASELIEDGSIVFIDASTTAMNMSDFLSEKQNLTIITNGIPLLIALTKKGIKTFSTGGELQENSLAYAGTLSEEFIKKFNIDICFFSSHGVTQSGMIVDTSLPETQLRKTVIEQSQKKVFLCDSTKFDSKAPYNLMPLEKADFIITNNFPRLKNISKNKIISVK